MSKAHRHVLATGAAVLVLGSLGIFGTLGDSLACGKSGGGNSGCGRGGAAGAGRRRTQSQR